jgi:predicted transcriptional regulator
MIAELALIASQQKVNQEVTEVGNQSQISKSINRSSIHAHDSEALLVPLP